MVFVGLGLVAPAWPTGRIAIVALTIAYGVEVSQLYHAPWIDHLRQIPLLRLVLGEGFLWSDFVCYTVGVAIGVVSERILNAVN